MRNSKLVVLEVDMTCHITNKHGQHVGVSVVTRSEWKTHNSCVVWYEGHKTTEEVVRMVRLNNGDSRKYAMNMGNCSKIVFTAKSKAMSRYFKLVDAITNPNMEFKINSDTV